MKTLSQAFIHQLYRSDHQNGRKRLVPIYTYRTTPIGVASLTAKTIITTKNVEETFKKLGYYALAVEVGLIIWGLIIVPIVFLIVRRRNPYKFIGTIMQSFMIVLATAST